MRYCCFVLISNSDGNKFTEEIKLALPINPNESTFKVTGSKIEFKLKKATEGLRWEVLENDSTPTETIPKPHNSSKDWDKIGKEADEEFKKDVEEGGGEAALQQMFKVKFIRGTFIVKTTRLYKDDVDI